MKSALMVWPHSSLFTLECVHLPTAALFSLCEAMEAKSVASEPAAGRQTEGGSMASLTGRGSPTDSGGSSGSSRATLQEVLVNKYNMQLSASPPAIMTR